MRLNRRRNSSNCDSPQNVSLSIRKIGWHFSLSLSLTPSNRRAELKLSNYQHPEWRETILLALHSIICGLTFVHFSCVLCFITIPHSIANLRAKAICHRLDVCVCVFDSHTAIFYSFRCRATATNCYNISKYPPSPRQSNSNINKQNRRSRIKKYIVQLFVCRKRNGAIVRFFFSSFDGILFVSQLPLVKR